MRAQILKDSVFMQEMTPSKLPVPVAGREIEFTMRENMTVDDFQQTVIANSDNSIQDFKLLTSDGKHDPKIQLG
jgi:hypothetical protein